MAGLVELSVSSDSPADSSAATCGSLGMVTTRLNGTAGQRGHLGRQRLSLVELVEHQVDAAAEARRADSQTGRATAGWFRRPCGSDWPRRPARPDGRWCAAKGAPAPLRSPAERGGRRAPGGPGGRESGCSRSSSSPCPRGAPWSAGRSPGSRPWPLPRAVPAIRRRTSRAAGWLSRSSSRMSASVWPTVTPSAGPRQFEGSASMASTGVWPDSTQPPQQQGSDRGLPHATLADDGEDHRGLSRSRTRLDNSARASIRRSARSTLSVPRPQEGVSSACR